jgi:hypothetical protein
MPSAYIVDEKISCWFSVPSLAYQMRLQEDLVAGAFPGLRHSIFCGEALPSLVAREWALAAPNSVVENWYGPTEATIACSRYRVTDAPLRDDTVPIGVAFPGMELIIRDDELLLAGKQLASGYLNDPEKSAASFITLENGKAAYRTGDRAALGDDGNVRFLGGNGRKRRAASKRRQRDDPALWQQVLFKEFQRKYLKVLDTRHHCRHCSGPIAESMRACRWCGVKTEPKHQDHSFPADCPRCHHGSKLVWRYCAGCFGPAFEVETSRRFSDKRYTARCAKPQCRGVLMPFMRYCPWCREKVRRPWKLPGSSGSCKSCGWGVDRNYWHHCPWCAKALDP